MEKRERFRGCLLGLAAGDAFDTTLEFKPPGTFTPITDMDGGGPFRLQPGQWMDDTSMALCQAESLVQMRGFDPTDQMNRYLRWYREGYLSSTGVCSDIGNTVRAALQKFEQTCRYFAALNLGALHGVDKETLLTPNYSPVPGYWQKRPLVAEIDEIAAGSFKRRQPPAIRGSGYVVKSLEAALWAFYHSTTFRDGCLMAANLGDDADTTAAVYGQLAGAYYGETGIPSEWREKLALRDRIIRLAERLYDFAHP